MSAPTSKSSILFVLLAATACGSDSSGTGGSSVSNSPSSTASNGDVSPATNGSDSSAPPTTSATPAPTASPPPGDNGGSPPSLPSQPVGETSSSAGSGPVGSPPDATSGGSPGAGGASEGGARSLGGSGGTVPVAGAPTQMAGASSGPSGSDTLTWSSDAGLWTAVRHYNGGTPSNRTSGPAMGPTRDFVAANESSEALSVDVTLAGPDAELFEILEPTAFPVEVGPGAELTVSVRVLTEDSVLGPAPAQDDGATVLEADLVASAGSTESSLHFYGLVLTYVELEPTFGQILDAFPYDANVGAAQNDANPNPGTLPGVEAGTDEVSAQRLRRANAAEPVTLVPIARFSPAGELPFGYYPPGSPGQATEVGVMARETDPHTNDKSRMLEPPLSRGSTVFDPGDAAFSLFMEPEGASTIYGEDAQNSDGQHRVKVFVLHDSSGAAIPNTYLIGGEEASNGDYQDYVFVLGNVEPE